VVEVFMFKVKYNTLAVLSKILDYGVKVCLI
jgi:hypothetical protein